MDLGISGKVMIVSGGARGIGAAIVRQLASEGAVAVVADRSCEAASQLVESIEEQGQQAAFIHVDLEPAASCRHVVEEVLGRYGRIDALVNNAGVNDSVGLLSGSPEAFSTSLARNLGHYYALAHYASEALIDAAGSIVNISSKTALTGQGGTSGYAAAKGAQLALTREWAVELLPHGVRVNAVVPAEVSTPQYETWLQNFPDPEDTRSAIMRNIPLGQRMTTPEEIASMVAFLVSDQASHITGQIMHVDGGYVHLDRALGALQHADGSTSRQAAAWTDGSTSS